MDTILLSDEFFMREAIKEAKKAYEKDEIPIGAVIVSRERIIARAHNLTETLQDVTAHAEMQAITSAQYFLGAKYLKECTLFVTLEPCPMCAGACYWSQMQRVVFGAKDLKKGYSLISGDLLHRKTETSSGILQKECLDLLQDFFKRKR